MNRSARIGRFRRRSASGGSDLHITTAQTLLFQTRSAPSKDET